MFSSRTIVLLASLITLAGCNDNQIFSDSSCSIDSVNDSDDLIVATKGNGIVKMAGWAADTLSKRAPETVTINLMPSNGWAVKLTDGKLTVPRPDVNAAFHAPSLGNVGFSLGLETVR
jgi:hypothetical protein